LIKVLKFGKFEVEEVIAVHLKTISVISQDPGYKFGNPVFYHDVLGRRDDEDSQGVVEADTENIESAISQHLVGGSFCVEGPPGNDQALQEIYSCSFAANEKPIHSKIPSVCWKVDAHGLEPVPRTTWIPGPVRRPLAIHDGKDDPK